MYLLLRLFHIFWGNTTHKYSEYVSIWILKRAIELCKIWDFHRCPVKVSVFWDMTSNLDFPVDGGSKLLWNFHTYVPNYMASSQKIGIFSFRNDFLFVVKVCINIMVLEAILSSYLFNSLSAKWTWQPWSNFCFIYSLWEDVIQCRAFLALIIFCWSGEYCTFQHIAVRQHCR